jgi:uncharacterized protein
VSKLILLLFLGLLAYLVFKGITRKSERRQADAPPASPERMVACAHCGVYLPESESLERDGRSFCSEEHRRLADS